LWLDELMGAFEKPASQKVEDVEAALTKYAKETIAAENNAAPSTPGDKDTDFENLLNKAIADGDFDTKYTSPLGHKFGRAFRPGQEGYDEFKACRTLAQKKAFRVQWATRVLKEIDASKTNEQSFKKVDKHKGALLTFSKIVEEYGYAHNPTLAITRATNYCRKCSKMGGDWTMWDSMGECMLFNWLKREYSTEFSEKWTMAQKEYTKGLAPKEADEGGKRRARGSSDGAGPPREPGSTPQDGKNSCGGSAETKASERGKPPKYAERLTKATKLKARYHSVTSAAQSLCEHVARDVAWAWAANEANIGKVQHVLLNLKESVASDPFASVFLAGNLKDIKANYGEEHLGKSLEPFLLLEERVAELAKLHGRLLDMHKRSQQ